jgi:hypothetical protein
LTPKLSFGHFQQAWDEHGATLKRLIEQNHVRRICEIGGGANPLLPLDYVRSKQLDYTILDVSQEELDKAPAGYSKLLADICASDLTDLGEFDLVFSKMLAEHVSDGRVFHRNVRQMLSPQGLAFHFFPTLFAPPFVVNWLLPETFASALLSAVAPRDKVQHAKFPAHYSWCRGPTARQIERLKNVGLDVVEYRGFFGHSYYKRIPGLRALSNAFTRILIKHPVPSLTTFGYLIVRRDSGSSISQPA